METIRIVGGQKLNGTIAISGAKNAALPLMVLGLLTDKPLVLSRMPLVKDTHTLQRILSHIGANICTSEINHTMTLQTHNAQSMMASHEDVRQMRASFLVLGGMLGRFGSASVSLPGGCAIGLRPVNYHLEGLKALGASVDLCTGYVEARAPAQGLPGGRYAFPVSTVTGTINVLLAAVLAKGESVLDNVAQEPEVTDVVHCLQAMGADIHGQGTSQLRTQGVSQLNGACHNIMADRIEMGTYMVAAALTQGDLLLEGGNESLLPRVIPLLRSIGVSVVSQGPESIRVMSSGNLGSFHESTEPYPGFPTDLQSQFMVLATKAMGTSTITENIWENRFMHVAELVRMGASIAIDQRTATIQGGTPLMGAHVMATDLRASVGLVLAGLVAQGETVVHRIYHLDRGYENLEGKLRACGAIIERHSSDGGMIQDQSSVVLAAS